MILKCATHEPKNSTIDGGMDLWAKIVYYDTCFSFVRVCFKFNGENKVNTNICVVQLYISSTVLWDLIKD